MLKFNDDSHSLNLKTLHLVKYDQFLINTKQDEWQKKTEYLESMC